MVKAVGAWTWDDGVLKASSPNIPTLTWNRPADLAEARLQSDPPVSSLEIADGHDLLTAAFGVLPFVREPLPRPTYAEAVTPSAREAFALLLGQNVAQAADSFRVLRGEVDDFIVFARRYHDVWKVGGLAVSPTTLTVRFEDLWNQLPPSAPRYTDYLVEVVRDAHERDPEAAQHERLVRETHSGLAPDVRISLDVAAHGGFTMTFWPVAARP